MSTSDLTVPPSTTEADSTPPTPNLDTRSNSISTSTFHDSEDVDELPPLDRLTIFDFIENLSLPHSIEKLQQSIATQREKVFRQQQKFKTSSQQARGKVVEEWKRRIPPPDEQLSNYRKRIGGSVDRLGARINDTKYATTREKASFIAGVLNIFISGYLIGAFPEYFHLWYTAQIAYFYPLRFYLYHRKGYQYFLADLCYYVNFLLLLSIWVFPQSKRLFISTFCLGFGNNAIAIAMWRNSLVFHSFDKVTSLFIHIMPCVTMHCMIHLIPKELQASRFSAVHTIKYSSRTSKDHYGLLSMVLWSTVPYAVWQFTYHILINIRRRDKIAAGRPTSFTYMRKSYSNSWIGKTVLSLPEWAQEASFMCIQYSYSILTMLPAPIWFWYRWPSAAFLLAVFTWCVYNGANYYVDIYTSQKYKKELEQLKHDVANYQSSPELAPKSPAPPEKGATTGNSNPKSANFSIGAPAVANDQEGGATITSSGSSSGKSTGVQGNNQTGEIAKRSG